jgi:membrane-associated phospholipid phosphatase
MKHIFLAALAVVLSASSWAQSSQNRTSDVIAVGLPLYAAAASYWHDDTQGLTQLVKTEAATLVLTEALKSRIHETRPDGSDNKSFPSEHASIAFAAAQYLQMKGGWEYGAPAYALATYASYLRVEAKDHYLKDIIGGGIVGAVTAYYFTEDPAKQRLSMSWHPGGVAVNWQQPLK